MFGKWEKVDINSRTPEKGSKKLIRVTESKDIEVTVLNESETKKVSSTFAIPDEEDQKKLYGYCVVSKDPSLNYMDGLTFFRGSPKGSHAQSDDRFSFDSDYFIGEERDAIDKSQTAPVLNAPPNKEEIDLDFTQEASAVMGEQDL